MVYGIVKGSFCYGRIHSEAYFNTVDELIDWVKKNGRIKYYFEDGDPRDRRGLPVGKPGVKYPMIYGKVDGFEDNEMEDTYWIVPVETV